ncbi:MAG: protein kinase [Planctomycetes bacterium]|nr:protein kinase [Planctomycetota bacterium]
MSDRHGEAPEDRPHPSSPSPPSPANPDGEVTISDAGPTAAPLRPGPSARPAGDTRPLLDASPRRAATPCEPTVLAGGLLRAATPSVGLPGLDTGAACPPTRTPPAVEPFGRYRLLRQLGRGGMGVVHKAWDCELERVVALKTLLAESAPSEEEVGRFQREARSAGRLRHPGIVQVHDVGAVDGRHYFTMDYIEGESLASAKTKLPLRRFLEVLREVALALHAAHEAGVIHRDVKPANILLDAAGRPYVGDFGLAKEVRDAGARGMTVSGAVMGTPHFMSPEQADAQADRIGPRSDVWSLGVILYEYLTGCFPFDGSGTVQIVVAILSKDPEPPGRAAAAAGRPGRVHRDLETICLTCLEKDLSRRYLSAAELAADIGRFLAGEPILARPVAAVTRILRKGVKHRAVVLPVACAVVVAAIAGGQWVVERGRRAHDAELALALGREFRARGRADEARDAFQKALALDRANTDAREGFDWADHEVQQRADGAAAALRKAQEAEAGARESLRKAGLAQDVLARAAWLAPTLEQLERSLYDSTTSVEAKLKAGDALWPPIEEFMRKTPADATSQSAMLAVAGWARLLAARPEEGRSWMRKARELDPDLPYGSFFEALVYLSAYLVDLPMPAFTVSLGGLAFGATPPDSVQLRTLRERMRTLLEQAAASRLWGAGTAEDFRSALGAIQAFAGGRYEEAERGLAAAGATGAMRFFRCDLLLAHAKVCYLLQRFEAGIADTDEVLKVRTEHAEAYGHRGLLRFGAAVTARWKGVDPRAVLATAVADYAEGIRREPANTAFRIGRANAWHLAGEAEAARGGDAAACFRRELEEVEAALRLLPEEPVFLMNRGVAHRGLGTALEARGEDPRPEYEAAIRDYGETLRRDPTNGRAYNNRASAWLSLGNLETRRGTDARASFRHALADLDESLRLTPEAAEAYVNRGTTWQSLGDAESAARQDPRPSYERAAAELGEALRRLPGFAPALNNRGVVFLKVAQAEAARGGDPRPSYDRAIADFDEALKVNPEFVSAYLNRGNARRSLAEAAGARGEDPRPGFRAAIADYEDALRRNPSHAGVQRCRAFLLQGLGDTEAARGGESGAARAAWEQAAAAWDELVRRQPADAEALACRGACSKSIGDAEAAAGRDGRAFHERALAAFGSVLERSPGAWRVRANRGQVLEKLERWPEALADYEAALAAAADAPPVLREWLAHAREKVGKGGK